MLFFILLLVLFLLGFLIPDRKKRKNFFAVYFGLLFFPIGVILALAKNYK